MRTLLNLLLALPLAAQPPLRINQTQFIGTHNSYHAGLSPQELALLAKDNPAAAESLAYKHRPIADQLDSGVRQLELDVFADSHGGLFANPLFLRRALEAGADDPMPPAWPALMQKPGTKVLHVSDVDFRSHCYTLTACLETVRAWSLAHPKHLPIFIQIETKTSRPRPGFVQTEPWTTAALNTLDTEIQSVFPPAAILTPDTVRGTHETLEAAVLANAWPTLEAARGKVAFLFDQESVTPLYTEGHPSLRGRIIFTNAKPGTPDAAFIKRNNPTDPAIPNLVRKGYLIRTMTDGGSRAVQANNTTRRDAAVASGAQILSTDYPFDWTAPSGYHVTLPGAKVRCNPINAPAPCTVPAPF